MAKKNVKVGVSGLTDMLYFKNKYKDREKHIAQTPALPLRGDIPLNTKAHERHPDEQVFIIEQIIDRPSDAKSYVLRRKDGQNPAFFRAGQFVVVRHKVDGKLIARPVSLSCGPALSLEGKYMITVKRVPDGFLSGYIHDNWKVGMEITTSGPQGVGYYEPFRDARKVIACAGGSGITPIFSMANAIADGDEDFEMTILYGSRTRNDIIFAEEFAEIQKRTDKVRLINVLSDEEAEDCEHGFITAELIQKYAGDGEYSVFAAGPQNMYRFLDGEIEKIGLKQKFYRKELFGSIKEPWTLPGDPMEAKDKVFNVHIKMCSKEYDIPCAANESIITAFERAGVAGPNRCRGGICGWCRSKLMSGEVFVPEFVDGRREADKVYGYIHPCASFALSDLVLDVPDKK